MSNRVIGPSTSECTDPECELCPKRNRILAVSIVDDGGPPRTPCKRCGTETLIDQGYEPLYCSQCGESLDPEDVKETKPMKTLTVVTPIEAQPLIHEARELLGSGYDKQLVRLDIATRILQAKDDMRLLAALDVASVIVEKAAEHVEKGGKVDGARAWYMLVHQIREALGSGESVGSYSSDLSRFASLYSALNPGTDMDTCIDVAAEAMREAQRQVDVGGSSRRGESRRVAVT